MIKRILLLLIPLCAFIYGAELADSLPWRGIIVFDTMVRVDDAPGLSGHPANHPQAIFDEQNMLLYAVWQDDRDNDGANEIYFAKSDTALMWSRPNINLSQSPTIDDVYPWLCVDSLNLYVVWQSWRSSTWKVYLTISSDGGQNWTTPDTVPGIFVDNADNSAINFGPQPKITSDRKTSVDTTFLYLIWSDNGTSDLRIRLARSLDQGLSFTDLGIIDQNTGKPNRHPYIVVDDSGWVHCAWARGTSGSSNDPHPWIGYNRSLDRGLTFMANDIIANNTADNVYRGNPTLTYNPISSNILVCWEDSRRASGNANPDIWFSRMRRDSVTFEPDQRVNWYGPDTNAVCDNYRSIIRMGPKGIMVAAWHDNPVSTGAYGIHMAAYSDSIGRFSFSQSLLNTFTGTTAGPQGNNFYAPSLFVTEFISVIDSTKTDTVTNFFIVWQDYYQDSTGGNIYSIRGRVVEVMADLDVDNDSLGVQSDTMDLRTQPAGPVYSPYAKGLFVLANTNDLYNPDSADGPSLSRVDSLTDSCTVDSVYVLGLPASMAVGQVAVCTVAVVIPVGTAPGSFVGTVHIYGIDSLGSPVEETFYLRFAGPQPRGSLDSLKIGPIPFTPHRDPAHTAIHFQGLPSGAQIRVYDQAGALVWSSDPADAADGHCAWPADKASGIYIYLVKAPDGTSRTGKLSVIR